MPYENIFSWSFKHRCVGWFIFRTSLLCKCRLIETCRHTLTHTSCPGAEACTRTRTPDLWQCNDRAQVSITQPIIQELCFLINTPGSGSSLNTIMLCLFYKLQVYLLVLRVFKFITFCLQLPPWKDGVFLVPVCVGFTSRVLWKELSFGSLKFQENNQSINRFFHKC